MDRQSRHTAEKGRAARRIRPLTPEDLAGDGRTTPSQAEGERETVDADIRSKEERAERERRRGERRQRERRQRERRRASGRASGRAGGR